MRSRLGVRALVGVNVGGDPLVHIGEMGLAEAAVASHQVALTFLGAARVLEMDGLQVVFVGVAARKDSQSVAAVVAAGPAFERAPELAIVSADFLPVALEVAEEVVGAGKAAVADFAHVGPRRGLQVGGLVGGQVGEVEVALGALALFARLPLFGGVRRRVRLERRVGRRGRGRHRRGRRRGRRLRLHRHHRRLRFRQLVLGRHGRRQRARTCREHGCGRQRRESCSGLGRGARKRRHSGGRERRPRWGRGTAVLPGHQVGEVLVQLCLEVRRR